MLTQPVQWNDEVFSSGVFPPVAQSDRPFRHAITNGIGVAMVYQPLYDARGQCASVEALVRYRMDGTIMPAASLIGRCRIMGLLPELGRHTHRIALNSFASFTALGIAPPQLALNVSAEEIMRPGYARETA